MSLVSKYVTYDPESPSGLRYIAKPNKNIVIGSTCGSKNTAGYYRTTIENKHYYCHQIVWMLHHGPVPEGLVIDHIDRNRGNNRIENLRIVSPLANRQNTRVGKTGHRNIILDRNAYKVQIKRKSETYAKNFQSLADAIAWRDAKLQELDNVSK